LDDPISGKRGAGDMSTRNSGIQPFISWREDYDSQDRKSVV
jgi:hypothetical protein